MWRVVVAAVTETGSLGKHQGRVGKVLINRWILMVLRGVKTLLRL